MTTKQIHETHIKIAFFAMLLIMLAAIYVAIPDFYSTVWQLSTSGNMQGTIDYLRSFGVWAVLVSMIIDIVINLLTGKREKISLLMYCLAVIFVMKYIFL